MAGFDDAEGQGEYPVTGAGEEAGDLAGGPQQSDVPSENSDDDQDQVQEATPVVEAASELEICPECSTDTPVGATFCPFCGTRLTPQTCGVCGAELESAWRYCVSCGAPRSGARPDSA